MTLTQTAIERELLLVPVPATPDIVTEPDELVADNDGDHEQRGRTSRARGSLAVSATGRVDARATNGERVRDRSGSRVGRWRVAQLDVGHRCRRPGRSGGRAHRARWARASLDPDHPVQPVPVRAGTGHGRRRAGRLRPPAGPVGHAHRPPDHSVDRRATSRRPGNHRGGADRRTGSSALDGVPRRRRDERGPRDGPTPTAARSPASPTSARAPPSWW